MAQIFLKHNAKVIFLIDSSSVPYISPYIKDLDVDYVLTSESFSIPHVLLVDHYSPGNILDNPIFESSIKIIIHDYMDTLPPGYEY